MNEKLPNKTKREIHMKKYPYIETTEDLQFSDFPYLEIPSEPRNIRISVLDGQKNVLRRHDRSFWYRLDPHWQAASMVLWKMEKGG